MAAYETQHVYTLTGSPPNFTAGNRTDATVVGSNEQPATDSFSPGDQITIFLTLPYAGFFGNGYIVQNGSNYILYSNDPSITSPFVMNTGVFPVCFLAGTAIAVEGGTRPVETLSIGDLVLTADGRAVPVRWVGIQTVVSVFADRLRPSRSAS
jgi:hypothetical protein